MTKEIIYKLEPPLGPSETDKADQHLEWQFISELVILTYNDEKDIFLYDVLEALVFKLFLALKTEEDLK